MNNNINGKEININYRSPFGLYIHLPFCTQKCSYCDFYSLIYSSSEMHKFILSLKKEICLYADILDNKELLSIYFGGGTPSLLTPAEIADILKLIKKYFSVKGNIEISLEANPDSLTRDKIQGYHQSGINRLSLGIQSFNNRELKLLGRLHTEDRAVNIIKNVREVFENYNTDLIFALPGQSYIDWEENLRKVSSFTPTHISTYNLELHSKTPLGKKVETGELEVVSEEIDAKMYKLAISYLQKLGYEHYEISNFARQGYESEHNKIYWEYKPYLGLGPSAHSFNGQYRYYNYTDLQKYIKMLTANKLPLADIITLTAEDLRAEMVIMGLRLMEGISQKHFYDRFGVKFSDIYYTEITKLTKKGLITINQDKYRLTDRGILLGNQVFSEFLPD